MISMFKNRFNNVFIFSIILVPLISATFAELPGFRVAGRYLYDKCGEKVILRGVNKMTVWTDINSTSFSEISKTGANCVRITWITSGATDKFDSAITKCYQNKMIPMVELHDATGEWSKLSTCVDWWVKPEVVRIIQKYEEYLLINIANECGQTVSDADFKTGYTSAITKMRTAGIHVPLVIDAAKYGQDIDILQSVGPDLVTADPDHNLLLSVHMWWPVEWGYSDQKITDEISQSVKMNLPLVVGEFAHTGVGCETTINYKHIIAECQKNDIGWLAWEWGPGNSDCTEMDMTTDSKFETLRDWALEVAVSDQNSIKNTAVRPKFILNNLCEGSQVTRFGVSVIVKGRGSVTISPNKSMVDSGQALTITAVADANNSFVNWSGSMDGTQNPLTVTVKNNLNITAEFTDNGPAVGAELVSNGNFTEDITGWYFGAYTPSEGKATVENGVLVVQMTTQGTEGWNAQLKAGNLDIVKGKSYIVSFKAKADEPFELATNVGLDEDPWTTYSGYQKLSIGTEMKMFNFEFTMGQADDRKARIVFDLGTLSGKIYFDDVSIRPLEGSSVKYTILQKKVQETITLRRGAGTFTISIPQKVTGAFELVDIAGKAVARLNTSAYESGSHTITFPENKLSSGTFMVLFTSQANRQVVAPLIIIK
jgi:hypothetical protein